MSNLVVLLFFVRFMCRNTSHSPCKESMEYASQRVASLEKVIRNALTLWKGCINVANDGHCECLPLATFSQPFQSVNTLIKRFSQASTNIVVADVCAASVRKTFFSGHGRH